MNKLITFIIPAHNSKNYLTRAVNSIISSNLLDYEILIIENGSKDSTLAEAKELKRKYFDVISIFESKKGVSFARNVGLKHSKGEWIIFLDSDDYFYNLEGIVRKLRSSESDLIVFNYEKGDKEIKDILSDQIMVGSDIEQYRIRMLENPTRNMFVWGKAFKRTIISKHSVYFDEDLIYSEDSEFVLHYTKYVKQIEFSKIILYHYSTDNLSTVRNFNTSKVFGYLSAIEKMEKLIEDENNKIKTAFENFKLMQLHLIMVRDVFQLRKSFRKGTITLKETMDLRPFTTAIKNSEYKGLSVSLLLKFLLKKRFFNLAGLVYRIRALTNFIKER